MKEKLLARIRKKKEKRIARKNAHPILFYVLSVLTIIVLVCAIYYAYAFVYRGRTENRHRSGKTSTEASVHPSTGSLKRALWMYPSLKKEVFNVPNVSSIPNTYVLPGLDSTRTLYTKDDQNFKLASCGAMTPQGLAVTQDHIIISAYCHTKKHNSVLYLIDKKTGDFVKEVVLQGRPHAGGIAYDPIHDMLWVATSSDGIASIASIPMSSLLAYDLDAKEPISYLYQYPVVSLQSSSFIAYYDKCLYIGLFTNSNNGAIYRYSIMEDGSLSSVNVTTTYSRNIREIAQPESVTLIENRIQGLAMNDNYQFLSTSWGFLNSQIYVHSQTDDIVTTFELTNVLMKEIYPRQLEQICVEDDDLYLLFESAAYPYRYYPLPSVDYVLRVNINSLVRE